MIQLLQHPGVLRVTGHMCPHGMMSRDEHGPGLVLKPTGWATNSPYIAEQVSAQCSNKGGASYHRHVPLLFGRARAAQIYPPKLCTAILKGLRAQLKADGRMQDGEIGSMCCEEPVVSPDMQEQVLNEQELQYQNGESQEVFYDDVTGELLDTKLVFGGDCRRNGNIPQTLSVPQGIHQ